MEITIELAAMTQPALAVAQSPSDTPHSRI